MKSSGLELKKRAHFQERECTCFIIAQLNNEGMVQDELSPSKNQFLIKGVLT